MFARNEILVADKDTCINLVVFFTPPRNRRGVAPPPFFFFFLQFVRVCVCLFLVCVCPSVNKIPAVFAKRLANRTRSIGSQLKLVTLGQRLKVTVT